MTSISNRKELQQSRTSTMLLERYNLVEDVGSGGMGRVYRAEDQQTGITHAIKVMHNHLRESEQNVKRFEREAKVAINLKHENIVAVCDYGLTETNEPFIVMEFLQGKSLADVLKETKRLSLDRFFEIFLPICRGLSYAHQSNIVHRDMKPSNVMLIEKNGAEQIKIVDFGIAKVCGKTGEICPTTSSALKQLCEAPEMSEKQSEAIEALERLTQPGEVFGSPLYMSPEQCRGDEADCRSEVYALGCMMFESLTGVAPLRGKNALETLFQRITLPAPSMSTVTEDAKFPAELEAVVARALKTDPDDRYQTVCELLEALQEAADRIRENDQTKS